MAQEGFISIDPQYDGVIMLSSEKVLFNDAKPRPDGSKIYHIFEKSSSEDSTMEGFPLKSDQLISQATETDENSIFQVVGKNGTVNQEWLPISSAGSILYSKLSDPVSGIEESHSLINEEQPPHCPLISSEQRERSANSYEREDSNMQTGRISIPAHCHFSPYKLHKFFSRFPYALQTNYGKLRLSRRLQKRGIVRIEYEPENLSLTIKTKRSASFCHEVLKAVDSEVRLISSCRDLIFCEGECSDTCPARRYGIANL